jgi:hypothetical protein
MPKFSDDDVLDFLVLEAIRLKMREEMKQAQDTDEREEWRKGHKGLTVEDLQKEAAARG